MPFGEKQPFLSALSPSPYVDCTSSLPSSGGNGTSCGQSVGLIPFLKTRWGLTSESKGYVKAILLFARVLEGSNKYESKCVHIRKIKCYLGTKIRNNF